MDTTKQRWTFISYSRKDKEFALAFARELKSAGYAVWLDQLDIPTGARWDDEVENALHDCDIFLIILTPASISSENVKDEIGYAIDYGKRILPVLLEECAVPLRLRRFQYVDFTKMEFGEGVKRAKQLLETLINNRATPVVKVNPDLEVQKIPKRETAPAPSLPVPNKPVRRQWIGRGAGILALAGCVAALGIIILFRDFIFPPGISPQSPTTAVATLTERATPTRTNRPPTRTSIPTLTPTVVQMTGEIVVDAEGHISPGFGNQWDFSTASSQILISINLGEFTDTCPIEVWVADTNANQIIFTETIAPFSLTYTAYVTLEPNKNYTVVVGGNDRRSSTAGCSGTEEFFFKIKVLS